jgi:peptide/nickel transport system permease protein
MMMNETKALILRVIRSPRGAIGTALMLIVLSIALLAPLAFPQGPWVMAGRPYLWPNQDPRWLFGTDAFGRNIVSGVFYGARVSLLVGVVATAAALVIGINIGAIAGYYGNKVDAVLMRFTDAVQTVPSFLFAIAIVAVLSPSVLSITAAIAFVSWPIVARLIRAEILRAREMEYVQACRMMGMSDLRIIFVQLVPNCMAPVIVAASVLVATAIITEAGLAFLGLGDPNVMSWGTMINIGRPSIRTTWYVTAIPGTFLVVAVLGLNLLGDAINDALNPHLRRR